MESLVKTKHHSAHLIADLKRADRIDAGGSCDAQ
jgi:hypothetical protein